MRICDWSSDVCSSDLGSGRHRFPERLLPPRHRLARGRAGSKELKSPLSSSLLSSGRAYEGLTTPPTGRSWSGVQHHRQGQAHSLASTRFGSASPTLTALSCWRGRESSRLKTESSKGRSEEHTSELQSLMSNTYAFFCLHKTNK